MFLSVNIVALMVEVVGLAVAAVGFRATWKEFHAPGDRFTAPVTDVLDWMTGRLNRLFHHQSTPRAASGTAEVGRGPSITVSVATASDLSSWSKLHAAASVRCSRASRRQPLCRR